MDKLSDYVFDYLYGNVDKEISSKIEDNLPLMLFIIENKKEYQYYEKSSDRLKTSFSFVSKLLDIFPPREVSKIASYYLENSKDEYIKKIEMICLLDELYEKTNDSSLEDFTHEADTFYMMSSKEISKEILSLIKGKKDIGDEFNFTIESFNNSKIILDFYARKRLDEIFLYGPLNSYEEFIHANFRSKDEILKKGFNNFLIEVLNKIDYALADYISLNSSLLSRYKDLNELVLDNWDNYLDTINKQKIEDINTEIINYIDKNKLSDHYFGLVPYIYSQTPYEDIYKKFESKSYIYFREPSDFTQKRFCEIFINRVVKKFGKDTLFGEDYYENSEKCEIINIEKVMKKK